MLEEETYELANRVFQDRLLATSRGESADSVTGDEVGHLFQALGDLYYSNLEMYRFIHVMMDLARDLEAGRRCPVCGRTENQNEELGYDCYGEC